MVDFGFTDQAIVHNTRPETRTKPMTLLVKSGETVLGRKVVKPEMGWHRWRLPIQGQRQIQLRSPRRLRMRTFALTQPFVVSGAPMSFATSNNTH